jgi:glycosyltransferase involved in cell wall biosynthesis
MQVLPWRRDRMHCINIGSNIEPMRQTAPQQQTVHDPAPRQVTAAHGAEAVAIADHTPAPTVAEGPPMVCFFGNLHASKGIEYLLDAFACVVQSIPDARLVLIGSFDPGDSLFGYRVRRKIIDTQLLERVEVTGFIPPADVSRLLNQADVCVLPFTDGVSIRRGTFLAAVRHDVPVITTRPDGPLPVGFVDGVNILLVEPGNVQQLAASMEKVLADPQLRQALKQNLAPLHNRFAWPDIARRTMEVYRLC